MSESWQSNTIILCSTTHDFETEGRAYERRAKQEFEGYGINIADKGANNTFYIITDMDSESLPEGYTFLETYTGFPLPVPTANTD